MSEKIEKTLERIIDDAVSASAILAGTIAIVSADSSVLLDATLSFMAAFTCFIFAVGRIKKSIQNSNPSHHAEPRFVGDSVDGVVGSRNQEG